MYTLNDAHHNTRKHKTETKAYPIRHEDERTDKDNGIEGEISSQHYTKH